MSRTTRQTNRRVYTRELLLAHRNVPDNATIIASIPEEIRITKYDKVDTIFNNLTLSCKPEKLHAFNKKDDLDPGSASMIACGA